MLALLGKRVPLALKVFLASVAVIDDHAAIIIIAIFCTSQLSMTSLGLASAVIVALMIVNQLGVTANDSNEMVIEQLDHDIHSWVAFGVSWLQHYGVSLLCGIGFIMSLFIGSLAFEQSNGPDYEVDDRHGILAGSLLSAVFGTLVFRFARARTSSRGDQSSSA